MLWEVRRELTTPIRKYELEREERRSIFLLGLLATIVTLRVSAKDSDQFQVLGIPYNLVPVLNVLVYAWVAYAALMLVFISDDLFSSRRWTVVRRLARLTGVLVAFETPLILMWVMLSTPSIFVIPISLVGYVIVLPFLLLIFYVYVILVRLIRLKRRRV